MGTVVAGCGEIVEVPVATTTGATAGSTGETEGSQTAGPTAGSTTVPDVDDASTDRPGADESTSGGGLVPMPFCSELVEALDVPEGGEAWAEAQVEVPPLEGASMLGISLRVTHPRVSDLRVVVQAPDGTATSLLDNPACDGPNVDAHFHDDAAQLGNDLCVTGEMAAIQGMVAPLDPLGPLLRTPVGGTWTLELIDTEAEERGWLDQVCVVLSTEGG